MADTKVERGSRPASSPGAGAASEGPVTAIDLQRLTELLDAHAKSMASSLGRAIGEKLAELKSEATEERRIDQILSEEREKRTEHALEGALEHEREEAWLAKYPLGDREHLKRIDRELRELEEALAGPEPGLDSSGGERPKIKGEARWQLPHYRAVPRDVVPPDRDD